jgi:predicted RNase H-like HicB family nuclease
MRLGCTITLEEKADGWWTASEETSGAVSQGASRSDALDHLDRAIMLVDEGESVPDAVHVPDALWFDE